MSTSPPGTTQHDPLKDDADKGHTNTARAGVGFNISFLKVDRMRGRVLLQWHDGSTEWVSVPSNVTIRATVDVGSNRPWPQGYHNAGNER